MGLARTLTRYQLLHGDWKLFLKMKEMVATVTQQEIMDVAKKYFTTDNMTVAYLVKKAK
jgi:predicted Zn-dependent peptidase